MDTNDVALRKYVRNGIWAPSQDSHVWQQVPGVAVSATRGNSCWRAFRVCVATIVTLTFSVVPLARRIGGGRGCNPSLGRCFVLGGMLFNDPLDPTNRPLALPLPPRPNRKGGWFLFLIIRKTD